MGFAKFEAYLRAMTTYTTPHFATGVSDGNTTRPQATTTRVRPASAATYRTAGVSNEAALMSDGQTRDWQPGVSKGVPKAAIGALGAALVGGVALAIVLMAPSNKVVKQTMPDPIAAAAASNEAAAKKVAGDTDAAVNAMNQQAPAAGNTSTAAAAADAGTTAQQTADAVPAPVEAVIPKAAPVAIAPVAHVTKAKAAPVARIATPQPAQQSAPVATPDTTPTVVAPPADVQAPAMQQTPETPTVTPSTPAPAPTPDTTPAPTPDSAPGQ